MVKESNKVLHLFTILSVAVINILIIMNNLNKMLVIILAFIVTFFLLISNTYVLNKKEIKKGFIALMYFFESFFLVVLLYFDSSILSLSLFLFLIGQVVAYSSIKFSLMYNIINYLMCVFIDIYRFRNINFNSFLNISTIFAFVYIFTTLLKYEINQRNKLEVLTIELKNLKNKVILKFVFNFFHIPKVPKTIKKALYRALQEGFTNGVKHGKSAKFKLVIQYVNNELQFELIDNGIGCDNLELGFGLNNMKYRIEQLGGDFRISSTLGEGTRISIKLPIEETVNNG